ncbi:MAG: hypothetical protein ABI543_12825 [Ignavibacteria bacterium]
MPIFFIVKCPLLKNKECRINLNLQRQEGELLIKNFVRDCFKRVLDEKDYSVDKAIAILSNKCECDVIIDEYEKFNPEIVLI